MAENNKETQAAQPVANEQMEAMLVQMQALIELNKAKDQESAELRNIVNKLSAKVDALPATAAPKRGAARFTPAKKFIATIGGVKFRFRAGVVKRGEIIVPTSGEGLHAKRIRIDVAIEDTELMKKLWAQESALLQKGKTPFGLFEIVNDTKAKTVAIS